MPYVRVAVDRFHPGAADEVLNRVKEGLVPILERQPGFVAYEGLRIRAQSNFNLTLPTAAMKNGDFSTLLGARAGADALGNSVFANEIFDPASTHSVTGGKLARDRRKPLGHELPVAVEVGRRVKIDLDVGQPLDRGRGDPLQVWRTVDRRFDRAGDKSLDLLRREARRLGLHIDLRRREFREDGVSHQGQ